jgi:hypothetical protein
VTRPEDSLSDVTKLAIASGGYLERLSDTSVTVRVPVAKFRDVYTEVLKMGDVLGKSISAQDVTDAFLALDLRLASARATRDRLTELLAKAQTEAEKLQLLREIQRLTEEIDSLEVQTRTLSTLAAFSRITVEAVARQPGMMGEVVDDVAAFRWIRMLSPFRQDVLYSGKRLSFDPPGGMVQLALKHRFIAESADGAVFRAMRLKNRPRGDSAFWMEALKQRLEPEFASAQELEAGEFRVLRLTERSDTPYQYLVGVRSRGRRLQVVEIYFPSSAQAERYEKAVLAVIAEGPGK